MGYHSERLVNEYSQWHPLSGFFEKPTDLLPCRLQGSARRGAMATTATAATVTWSGRAPRICGAAGTGASRECSTPAEELERAQRLEEWERIIRMNGQGKRLLWH
ncbi:hypothetical protein AAFF_G00361770 [Aldrovandia affinis]|uniref:Uncharacterized protein n=1 Tax=Aldrovandia affinis TaxID=143900 RepID=A0AAD7SHX6_9TELE|nr:hypothetical protein AAFF_G00361770 [Aldrovandia affinis]